MMLSSARARTRDSERVCARVTVHVRVCVCAHTCVYVCNADV
jgi:hypothetical protein